MVIAMYGYGWLKPAGCAKTMLGRREEEVEREEVERQLREVELQERMQQEADEQERLARLAETGEPEVDRDLDEDIPDADGEEVDDVDDDGSDGYPEEYEDEEMEGDLDDEIPDADEEDEDEIMSPDPDGIDANWVYDTRREPDSDDDEDASMPPSQRSHLIPHPTVADLRIPVPGSEYDYDEREAEDLANAMLDEDEIFDDQDVSGGVRDLDDDVPEAESDQAWEHTDTELEESEMDISNFPGQDQGAGSQAHIGRSSVGHPRRSSGRIASGSTQRSSGPWIADPSPQPQDQARRQASHIPTPDMRNAMTRTRVLSGTGPLQHQYIQTPAMLDSPLDAETELDTNPFAAPSSSSSHLRPDNNSNILINNARRPAGRSARLQNLEPRTVESTNTDDASRHVMTGNTSPARAARNWLDGAAAAVGGSARRTLFGRASRRDNSSASSAAAGGGPSMVSSAGLFTPSPRHAGDTGSTSTVAGIRSGAGAGAGAAADWETPVMGQDPAAAEGQGRTRSGRFLGGRRRGAD